MSVGGGGAVNERVIATVFPFELQRENSGE